MHIAMWSGPRNLSTAMMYSFGAREDFVVMDEPFYGAYLNATGLDHPMGDDIVAAMECDPGRVARQMSVPDGVFLYSKQMAHHMIDGFDRTWFHSARHAFLIRHPARVVASYAAKREKPTLEDIGFAQQLEIFEQVQALGQTPVVIDSLDIRADPKRALMALCHGLDIDWDESMLTWPKGGHASDGIWAAHWYGAVHNSTGFAEPEGELPLIEPDLQRVVDAAMPIYETMAAHKI